MVQDIPTYDPVAVAPFRQQLTDVGFRDLTTPEEVDEAILAPGTVLVVLNSVCGCSAGSARPGVGAALQNARIPDRLVALFAGQEKTAVAHLRATHLASFAPSSPNIALFRDGELVMLMERRHIQAMDADEIAGGLVEVFDKVCQTPGPSVPTEVYEGMEFARSCGSKIARNDGAPGSC
ncbi:MAG: BrxA/BrxB family bacilliredoxin [Fibrobacteria bacterium]|nr:BrxA/BrxB family bacilliredoxin [Fibrobacteria bacterium]